MCAYKIYMCLHIRVQGSIGERAHFVLYKHAGREGKHVNTQMRFCRFFPINAGFPQC